MIAPYRRQVQKLRQKLKSEGLGEVMVGSTEEFQGQERRIIIVSTVRSTPQYVNTDKQYKLGFLQNPKRFNVAITRWGAGFVKLTFSNWIFQTEGSADHCRQPAHSEPGRLLEAAVGLQPPQGLLQRLQLQP